MQQSNYKQDNVQNSQGFKSQPQQQQQQQQSAQMPAAASTRPVPTVAPTQLKLLPKPQQQLQQPQQGQQQKLQLQQQQQKLQQQQSLPQQINQPAMQQQMNQPVMQQQQQSQQVPNLALAQPQRLKPILKQSTAIAQPAKTVAQTPHPALPAPSSTNNNSDSTDDSMKNESTDVSMQDAQPRWRRKIPGCKYV